MPTTAGFGVSDSLRSIFAGLSQAQGRYGQKYSDQDINKVKQYICCRNYSKASYELVYLCWAIINACPVRRGATPLEAFFWLDEAHSPQRCRVAFSQPWQGEAGQVAITSDYLSLNIGKGASSKSFNISPARVGVLAVLMEFIITVDPSLLSKLQNDLLGGNDKDIDQVARLIQQSIYQFLKDHLPEAQIQTRYRYFENWLNTNGISPTALDDSHIISFWQDACADEQAQSYVLYATALFDALDAISAMQIVTSQQAVSFAASFGQLAEQGEVNPEQVLASQFNDEEGEMLQTLVFADVATFDEVKTLCTMPKCLTQEEAEWLQPLVSYATYIKPFLLSFMRLQVFAKWQSVLVQAKRKSAATLTEKLAEPPVQAYAMYQLEIDGLAKALENAQHCLQHVLLNIEPEYACAELLQQLPTEQLQKIGQWLAEQQSHESYSPESWHSLSKQLSLQFQPLRQLCDLSAQAFKKNNKAGFKKLPSSEQGDIYLAAFEHITSLQKLTQAHGKAVEQLAATCGGLSRIFASDVCIFTHRFNTLYGDHHAS